MILESGKISKDLADSLNHVVDSYAKAPRWPSKCALPEPPSERPGFIVITSMKARDPYFYKLFLRIRDRIDNPLTPLLCLDSLEHEYLIANHLFEMYINPASAKAG